MVRFKIYSLKELKSTQEFAKNLISRDKKDKDFICIFSLTQTKGRGRFDRKWISPPGGLYISLILKNREKPSRYLMIAALSIVNLIRKISLLAPKIKWPNDIMLDDKKIGGILTEVFQDYIILGIGLNINTDPYNLPRGASSLFAETGTTYELEWVLKKFLKIFAKNLEKTQESILKEFRINSSVLGRFVSIKLGESLKEGFVLDFDNEGAMILRTPQGLQERIIAVDSLWLR